MSLDSRDALSATDHPISSNGREPKPKPLVDESQWKSLRNRVMARSVKSSTKTIFGESAKGGAVYRWGMAAAMGRPCDQPMVQLSRLACGERSRKHQIQIDLNTATTEIMDQLNHVRSLSTLTCGSAVTWAAALPALTEHLDQQTWWNLLGCLQQFRESIMQRNLTDSPAHLLIGAELGLTLSWRLADFPSCKRLQKSSIEALTAWCKHDEESISASIIGAAETRLVLASLVRCRRVLEKTTHRKFKKQQLLLATALATWVAAMTTRGGCTAFSKASQQAIADDLPPHGLLGQAMEFDRESLEPAISAALGKTQSGGRLAWEVCLPDAFHHNEDAKVAVMFPDWDVRRGRIHLDYGGEEVRLELFAGRLSMIAGRCQSMIELDGEEQQACGDWDLTCEYTDDDVHYLEIEQPWTGGVLLQRQLLLLRDDRCVLFADSVLPKDLAANDNWDIQYNCRLPLAPSIAIDGEAETRDAFFSDGRRRGLIMPLSASEWRVGPTEATLKASEDGHLLLTARGSGSLYAPLWFDLQRRRFKRQRTWRQLTVADELRTVGHHEAVGYRVQVGSEQWLIYRSFGPRRCRSVLGKHLVADFFVGRFDTGDGSLEELVTVDDNHLIDD